MVAIPPLDLFADLRVLFSRATSWPLFIAGLLASLVVRMGVLALIVGAHRATRIYGIALVPAIVAGGIEFAALGALYHWLFWIGTVITAATFLVTAPVLGTAGRAVYLGLLTLLGAAASTGTVTSIAVVVPSAVLTAAALSGRLPGVSTRTALGVGAVCAMAGTAWVVVDPLRAPTAASERRSGSLFLVAGHGTASGLGTMYHFDPADLGYTCDQTFYFSYRGPGDGAPQRDAACPIVTGAPYGRDDSRRPLESLAAEFQEQVAQLDPPVVVVGHSQGGWIAWRALATARRTLGVNAVVLLGPVPHTGVDWHQPGEHALRAVMALARAGDWTTFDPTDPLPRETLAAADALERIFGAPLGDGTRALTVTSMLDLPVLPEGWRVHGAADTCPLPVTHSGLVEAGHVTTRIRLFLEGAPLSECPSWSSLPGRLTHAWGAPAT